MSEIDTSCDCRFILGMRVDLTSYARALADVESWVASGRSAYICEAPVHMVMEAYGSPKYKKIINAADLVTPGGVPLVWYLRAVGARGQGRVYGPELMLKICERAARSGLTVGFYGTTPQTLSWLASALRQRFPCLLITFQYAPPFRAATIEEDDEIVTRIHASGSTDSLCWAQAVPSRSNGWRNIAAGCNVSCWAWGPHLISSPGRSRRRHLGCKGLGLNGCSVWPRNRPASGFGISGTTLVFYFSRFVS